MDHIEINRGHAFIVIAADSSTWAREKYAGKPAIFRPAATIDTAFWEDEYDITPEPLNEPTDGIEIFESSCYMVHRRDDALFSAYVLDLADGKKEVFIEIDGGMYDTSSRRYTADKITPAEILDEFKRAYIDEMNDVHGNTRHTDEAPEELADRFRKV